jgi:hypothetical protein
MSQHGIATRNFGRPKFRVAHGAYFSSERTFCWLWLAWAIIAVEACEDLRLGQRVVVAE